MYALFFCRCASALHKKCIICGMRQRIYKKSSAYMQPFFVDALAHYIKTHIICGMCQRIYKKVAHTQAFRTHFRLTWSPKPETGTRNPKPKPFKMRPSTGSCLLPSANQRPFSPDQNTLQLTPLQCFNPVLLEADNVLSAASVKVVHKANEDVIRNHKSWIIYRIFRFRQCLVNF